MIIRHVSNPENENYIRFEAVDAQNDVQGVCRVEKSCCTRLFPARPLQVRIDMSDAGEQQALLMGAAMAFAVQSADMPARFYVPCDPEDKGNIDMLKIYDFRNDDGVVRMARSIDHIPENPEIEQIKEQMIEAGALNALMSGSGPTVFGIFKDKEQGLIAKEYVREKGLARQIYLVSPYNVRH